MKKDIYKNLRLLYFSDKIKKDFPDKKLKALIFGNFGAMNMGDEAILAGELQELRKIKNLTVQVVTRNPKEIKRLHHADSISMYNLPGVIKEVDKSDFIIVGGGGIICKADRNLAGIIYQIYMLFLYLGLPKFFNKKIYAVGIGVYDNANSLVLSLSTALLKSVSLLTVRDYHSMQFLKSKGLSANLYKDNSFLMDLIPESEVLKDKFFKENYDPNKKNIGFALLKPDTEKDEKHLLSEIKKLVNKNYKYTNFWLYSCDFQGNFYNDKKFSEKIYNLLEPGTLQKKSLILVPTYFSPTKFFSSFKLMNFFITMRLHGAIFAYRNKIDFLGLTYDQKCSSFLKSIGKDPIKPDRANFSKT